MKTKFICTLALLMICYSSAFSQTNNFLVTDKGQLIWQKTFESELTREDVFDQIVNDGSFVDIADNGGVITCSIKPTTIDVESMGCDIGMVPMYVTSYDFSGFASIQFKEGRYRVTVEKMQLTTNPYNISNTKDTYPIEKWTVRDNSLSPGFRKKPSAIYDKFLTDKFKLEQKSYLNDEW